MKTRIALTCLPLLGLLSLASCVEPRGVQVANTPGATMSDCEELANAYDLDHAFMDCATIIRRKEGHPVPNWNGVDILADVQIGGTTALVTRSIDGGPIRVTTWETP